MSDVTLTANGASVILHGDGEYQARHRIDRHRRLVRDAGPEDYRHF
jgi:hypothetical protein